MKPWKPNYSITPDIARSLTNQTVQGPMVYRQFTGNLPAIYRQFIGNDDPSSGSLYSGNKSQ
jgi:hypothetical protein